MLAVMASLSCSEIRWIKPAESFMFPPLNSTSHYFFWLDFYSLLWQAPPIHIPEPHSGPLRSSHCSRLAHCKATDVVECRCCRYWLDSSSCYFRPRGEVKWMALGSQRSPPTHHTHTPPTYLRLLCHHDSLYVASVEGPHPAFLCSFWNLKRKRRKVVLPWEEPLGLYLCD